MDVVDYGLQVARFKRLPQPGRPNAQKPVKLADTVVTLPQQRAEHIWQYPPRHEFQSFVHLRHRQTRIICKVEGETPGRRQIHTVTTGEYAAVVISLPCRRRTPPHHGSRHNAGTRRIQNNKQIPVAGMFRGSGRHTGDYGYAGAIGSGAPYTLHRIRRVCRQHFPDGGIVNTLLHPRRGWDGIMPGSDRRK